MLNIFSEAPQHLLAAIVQSIANGVRPEWELHRDGSLRLRHAGGMLRPKRYKHGLTLQYCSIDDNAFEVEVRARAVLHARMLEWLATDFLGTYSYIVFEPKPLRSVTAKQPL